MVSGATTNMYNEGGRKAVSTTTAMMTFRAGLGRGMARASMTSPQEIALSFAEILQDQSRRMKFKERPGEGYCKLIP